MELKKIQKQILPILKKHGVVHASFFGSFARNEQKKNSDVDIMVEIKKNISLFDFIGLQLELEDKIGRKVDLVEKKLLKPLIKESIDAEKIVVIK
jgi:hypothetical protein